VVEPIGQEQRNEVLAVTEHYICQAEGIFERRFKRIPVLFDLRGRSAGMFKIKGRERLIRYNPWIFGKYYQENLHDTVAHEVAHYVIHEVFGRQAKAHGEEWQSLMVCFGANPSATFDLDLSDIPQRRQATHPYRCHCQVHEISTTRHNRILRGRGRYHCRYCDGLLVYAPHESADTAAATAS
jgi:SprT protein